MATSVTHQAEPLSHNCLLHLPNSCQRSVDAPILQTGKLRLREAQTTELGWTALTTRSISVSNAKGPSLYSAPCILLLVIQLVDSGAVSWMPGTQR